MDDMFAIGCLFYEILIGKAPYSDLEDDSVLRRYQDHILSCRFLDLNVWDWIAYELCFMRVMCLMSSLVVVILWSRTGDN